MDSEEAAVQNEIVQEIAFITPDVETTCRICHAEFLDSEDLNVHINQVHNSLTASTNSCQFCDVNCTDLEDYALHIRDVHLIELKCCSVCSKAFPNAKLAKKHEKKHKGLDKINTGKYNMFACSQCTCQFLTRREVQLHESYNHDNIIDGVILKCVPHLSSALNMKCLALLQTDERVLICHKCEFTSFDLSTYVQHLREDNCKVFVCNKCGDVFKSRKNIVKHLRFKKIVCMDANEYANELTKCQCCNTKVHGKNMGAHLKLCKIYCCQICNITFNTIDELSSHQSQKHPSELDIVKCKYCPKEFASEEGVNKHVERAHQASLHQYKYACKQGGCNAIFKHPQNLFAHYFTTHKDLQPYTCKICNLKFKIRKRFTIHIKMEHKAEGMVEFDEQYHVFFTDKKSENPFIPKCVIPEVLKYDKPNKGLKVKNIEKLKVGYVSETDKTLKDSFIESERELVEVLESENDNVEKAVEPKMKTKTRRQRKRKHKIQHISDSSDEEGAPLLIIKKRAERKLFQQQYSPVMKHHLSRRKQFTCNICGQYCYTYQNFHNHMKAHSKNELIECIKCFRSFSTKAELNEHMSSEHATSKLIETLKSVLERKQGDNYHVTNNQSNPIEDQESTRRFLKTMKRVKFDTAHVPAKISPAPNNLSVKKFIENFIPDANEAKDAKPEQDVRIKRYDNPFYRKKIIKLTKFTPEVINESVQLKMPEKFKAQDEEKVKVNIKVVQHPLKQSVFESYESPYENDTSQDFNDYDDDKNDTIPEVAQEVMLEGTEEPPKPKIQAPQKIVIPKLPQGYNNIHIATLHPQAPYFKIIKVKGGKDQPIVIDTCEKEEEEPVVENDDDGVIRLPDGTRFVTANPLAHLLGGTPVAKVLEPLKNKHYKPAITNFKGMLAEALKNLDKPTRPKKSKKTSLNFAS